MSTTKTLTVAQLLVLTTAAQRPEHMVLPVPPTIRARGGAQRNLLGALLKMELVAEVPVDDASIAWRTDEAGQHHSLRITAAGLTAAGTHDHETLEPTGAGAGTSAGGVADTTSGDADTAEEPGAAQVMLDATPRRPTGKLGQVLQAISADAGATLAEITVLAAALRPHRRKPADFRAYPRGPL